MLNQLQRIIRHFHEDSLFRNATYIMMSTVVTSLLGFGFWLFVARLYSPTEVGIASALMSISILISNLSLLGLNSGLIRFLPKSKQQSADINAALVVVALATILATGVYALISRRIGEDISWFTTAPWHAVVLMGLMVAVSLNTLTDAVFIANRRAQYHTITYAAFGLTKLVLPIVFVSLGSLGIFLAYIAAVFASLVFTFFFMWRACGYALNVPPNWRLITQTRRYATNNYLGVIMAAIPVQVMPLFIVHKLGAAESAFFALAWTMVNLIYVVPSSVAQSLLAESSHDPEKKKHNLLHAVKLLSAILIPVVLVAVVVAPYLLRIFGVQYAEGSAVIFQILALSTFFVCVNTVGNTVLNIEHKSSGIIAVQFVVAVVTLGSVQFLIRFGLMGVGLAMMLGYAASNLVYVYFFLAHKKSRRLTQATEGVEGGND